jgi:outer membrane receptor for ferrienterochelin and colicin
MRHGSRAALLLAAALLATPPARADGTADEADVQFRLGHERFKQGAYDEALAHFLVSNRLVPNRNVVFNIATTCEQLKRYADAYRYYLDALAGEGDPRAASAVRAALERIAPNVAVLDVTTTPPGATIYVDRKDLGSLGSAPRLFALPPGRYRVIAELAGYEPAVAEAVELTQGGRASIALTLAHILGTVSVEAGDAAGATVRVDDPDAAPAGVAPCELSLPPGAHELFFALPGRHATSRRVVVAARQSVKVAPALRPLTGSLVVETDERDAAVTVDGAPRGKTPSVIGSLPVGRHRVRVSLRGYAPEERDAEIKVDEQTRVTLELTPQREVTAVSRYAERLDEAPSSVSVIDGRELRAFGYPTIAESLRGVRGVSLNNDRAYWSIGIRGLGLPNDYGNRVLLLSDGQPLNDNLLNSAYVGSDGRADLHDVDRIEVVRGPGSLLYGAGAFSGVVNLVGRPRDEPSQVHASLGSYDDAVVRARAGFHYNHDEARGVWASVSAAHSAGTDVALTLKDPAGGPAVRTASRADAFDSVGTAGRAWWGPATLQWFFHTRKQTLPIGAYETAFGDPRSNFRDTRLMTELRVEPKLGDQVQLMVRVHGNRYEFHGLFQYPDGVGAEDYYGTWFGAEARVVYTPIAAIRITAGGEGQLHPQATLEGRNTGGAYLDEHDPYRFAAAYALAEASPARWLRASAGARVDVYSTFGPIAVPRAALVFKPREGTVLKIMGGRAFRAPSIYEQVYNDGNVSEVRSVDPKRRWTLGPESVYSGELEASQRFLSDWIALAAAHVSHVQGLVVTTPTTGCLPAPAGQEASCTRYTNSGAPVLIAGGDVEVRREWRKGLMLAATYGYQRVAFLDPKRADPRVVNAPEHLASLRGVVPVVRELLSLALRATLEAPRRIRMESADTTEAGVILDAAVSGDVRAAGLHYTVGVYNIADFRAQYPVTETFLSRTMTQNGRTFLIDVTVSYP